MSSCPYLSSTSIINLIEPKISVDLKMDPTIIDGKENIGYGVWMKYQPFFPISESSISTFKEDLQAISSQTTFSEFIYSLEQKDSKFQMLILYVNLDLESNTISHQVFYSFKVKTNTLQFPFQKEIYESQWILFYMFCNQLQGYTIFGFYQSDLEIPLMTQEIQDIPSFTKSIRYTLGGTKEFTNQLGQSVSLSQFKGRFSNLFSFGEINIFSDIDSLLQNCPTIQTCQEEILELTTSNYEMQGVQFLNFVSSLIEEEIYVLRGWIKLALQTELQKTTVIFRITINKNYNDDIIIGDRALYLQYYQNIIPDLNGFSLITYTYEFPVQSKYTSTSADTISAKGVEYQTLLTQWHYIQYEIGTLNNYGQPLFSVYFPSLTDVQQFKWTKAIKHFTGSIFYLMIGGDSFTKHQMIGYFSELTLTTYCEAPEMVLIAKCHHSCSNCVGPNMDNCIACPSNSHRIFSAAQQTCACLNNYIEIEKNPICQHVSVIFPSLQWQELEISCPDYAFCLAPVQQCLQGYFPLEKQCIKCPEYFSIDHTQILCANCHLYPSTFASSLKCDFDMITYEFNPDNSFHEVRRNSTLKSFYQILQNFDGSYIIQLKSGFVDNLDCKDGFFLDNNQCLNCLPGCRSCSNQFYCVSCYNGYSITDSQQCEICEGCTSCSLIQSFKKCLTCAPAMYLFNGVCYSCGQNCASCNNSGYCYYCDDPSHYFLTFDGVNCQVCNIDNCQYCYSFYTYQGATYTTFDILLVKEHLSSVQLQVGCARCSTNLYFNQITLRCQNQPPASSFCTFGLITDTSGNTQCLISDTSLSSIQKTSCSIIPNCGQCIENYYQGTTFCIICNDGYYSGILTGKCKQCQAECRTCIQVNSLYRDYWKWDIKAYYKYVFNFDDQHPFETQATQIIETDFSLICTSCQFGYLLYEQKCILNCEEKCNNCQVIDGVATCIQCQHTPNGYLKSQTNQGICQTCPNYCSACKDRTPDEIFQLNPYFIVTEQNMKYTRICYDRFTNLLSTGYYFYDQFLKTYIVCDIYEECLNSVTISYNLYCSEEDFNMAKQNESEESNFLLKNSYINDLFISTSLLSLETIGLFTYLNDKVVQNISFYYTIIQGSLSVCQINSLSSMATQIQQYVFAVQSVSIFFTGLIYPTIISLADDLAIYNFSKITFENICFDLAKQFETNDTLSTITISSFSTKNIILELKNCEFTTNNSTNKNYSFEFGVNQQYSLIIENLSLINLKIYDSKMFFFGYPAQYQLAQISNLTVENCYFYETIIFQFYAENDALNYEIVLTSTIMRETQFYYSILLAGYGLLYLSVGNIYITSITLDNMLITESSILYIENSDSIKITDSQLTNSKLFMESYYLQAAVLTGNNIYFNNITLENSYLMSNNVSYLSYFPAKYFIKIDITNCTMQNISYNLAQTFIQLLFFRTMITMEVTLSIIELNNCIHTMGQVMDDISYDQSIIYLECQSCKLENVIIKRNYGLPEFSIINSNKLEIYNFTIIQDLKYHSKTLHTSYDCIEKFAYTQQFFALYVGNYQEINIDNISITSSISYNNPFIYLKGFDLKQKISAEILRISNSNFEYNMLLLTKSHQQAAIIQIQSEQQCVILFSNLSFSSNHLHEYFSDITKPSASTLLILLQKGNITIENSFFENNLVTNSTDSILFIESNKLFLSNTEFHSNNILNSSLLYPNLLLTSEQSDEGTLSLESIFKIKSKSGNGMFVGTTVLMEKIIINLSFSCQGGGFYLNSQGAGNITISNSIFADTSTSLIESSFSAGGCLYIDASLSSLTFKMSNSSIEQSYSRVGGGGITILPSETYNQIELNGLKITNCFSLTAPFFLYQLSNQVNPQSTVYFKNIEFYATEDGFERFLTIVEDVTDFVEKIQTNNPMIFIQYGNVHLCNCTFQSTHIMYLLRVEFATNIILENILIQNSSVLFSPLMSLNLRQSYEGTLLIENFKVINVKQFANFFYRECSFSSISQSETLTCPTSLTLKNRNLQNRTNTKVNLNQIQCNKQRIYTNTTFEFSLIEINNLDQTHNVRIFNATFENNNCSECSYGLLKMWNVQSTSFLNILINNLKMNNNICGYTGCLSVFQYYNTSVIRSDLLSNQRLLQQFDYDEIQNKLTFQININYCTFQNNSATYGGAITIVEVQILIRKCSFINNKANIGGAIYYFAEQTTLYIFDSQFVINNAEVAGGLYLNSQSLQQTSQLDVVLSNNNSTLFGSDISESPRSLTISVDGGKTLLEKKIISHTPDIMIDQITVQPYTLLGQSDKTNFLTYPSGQEIGTYSYFDPSTATLIPYNLTFRVIALNKYQKQEKQLFGSFCTLSSIAINSTDETTVDNITANLSYNQVYFNVSSGDYNLDNLIIYFHPKTPAEIIMRLRIHCNMIQIPQYSSIPPYLILNYIANYFLEIDIRTFQCQLGEFLNSTSGGCVFCDKLQNQYQVQRSAQSCSYKDDVKMKSISSSMIELRPSYWRAYYYSQTIDSCYHLFINCAGGWYPGDASCIAGHIGALCEQCDLYDTTGKGSYSTGNSYSCRSCDQIYENVLSILLISIWTLISILMSVSSTIEMIGKIIVELRLKSLGVPVVIKQASTAILIKVLTNYLQIISTIATFQLTVPSGISSMVNSVGNPIQQLAYSLDCFLISISDILIIYFRIIWSLLLAGAYLAVFFILYSFAIAIKKVLYNFSFITTAIIYVFIYLQPNIITGLISLISYRIISDEYWIQGNVAYRYDTSQHVKWLISFCSPLLLTFGFLIPLFLWSGVYKNKHQLDNTRTRKIWGYLYNEYKPYAYYWETIKIFQKELIIIVLAYYEDYIPIKASLVFLFLFGYSFLTTQLKPYMTGDLNYLDSQSTIFCAVSIILGSSIYTAQQSNLQEIVWPCYIIIGILNAMFAIKMLLKILFAYFDILHDQIDKLKAFITKCFPNLCQRFPYCQYLLESRKKRQARVKERFGKIKQYLFTQSKLILRFKKQYYKYYNLDLSSKVTKGYSQFNDRQTFSFTIPTKSENEIGNEKVKKLLSIIHQTE